MGGYRLRARVSSARGQQRPHGADTGRMIQDVRTLCQALAAFQCKPKKTLPQPRGCFQCPHKWGNQTPTPAPPASGKGVISIEQSKWWLSHHLLCSISEKLL